MIGKKRPARSAVKVMYKETDSNALEPVAVVDLANDGSMSFRTRTYATPDGIARWSMRRSDGFWVVDDADISTMLKDPDVKDINDVYT